MNGIILFETTQAAIRAEKVLNQAGIRTKLIPVPRHISSNCGISLQFDFALESEVKSIIAASGVQVTAIRLYTILHQRDRELAIVLVSGGMDSCVTAAIAAQEYNLAFLHVSYGQRTQVRELKAFNEIADYYNIEKRLTADISYLEEIGGSSLTDENIPVAESDLESIEDQLRGTIPSSYVPFRNTHLLSIAVSWAEVIGASRIFIGAVEEDSSGYPDCRKEFYRVFNELIKVGVKPETHIQVITPVIGMRKSEIILKGVELGAPLSMTWSCYKNTDRACGVCDSCILRLRGFREAGIEDPIEYDI